VADAEYMDMHPASWVESWIQPRYSSKMDAVDARRNRADVGDGTAENADSHAGVKPTERAVSAPAHRVSKRAHRLR
jgi:hypothetical protein